MLPIKQLLFTFPPGLPIQITLEPVVTLLPAPPPNATFSLPVVLEPGVPAPIAVLRLPVRLLWSETNQPPYCMFRWRG